MQEKLENAMVIKRIWALLSWALLIATQNNRLIGGLCNSKTCFLHHLDFFRLENWIESIFVLHNERPQHMPVCISTSQLGLQHSTYKNRPFFRMYFSPLFWYGVGQKVTRLSRWNWKCRCFAASFQSNKKWYM